MLLSKFGCDGCGSDLTGGRGDAAPPLFQRESDPVAQAQVLQVGADSNLRSFSGNACDMQRGADAAGALLHAENAESFLFECVFESTSVVFDGQLNGTVLEAEPDLEHGGIAVAQGVGNGFAADVQQGVGEAQVQWDGIAAELGNRFDLIARGFPCGF